MKRWLSDLLAIVLIGCVVGWAGIQYGRKTQALPAAADASTIQAALVEVELARAGSLPHVVTGIGKVMLKPGATQSYTLPIETEVIEVDVLVGDQVQAGQRLARFALSPEGALRLQQARDEVHIAQAEFASVKERMALQLAVQTDVLAAQAALERAQTAFKPLESAASGKALELLASAPGLVTRVELALGTIRPASETLVEIAAVSGFEVALRVEPRDLQGLGVGDDVRIEALRSRAETLHGQIRAIAPNLDPVTAQATVMVSLKGNALLIDEPVRGFIQTADVAGVLVTRTALHTSEAGLIVFVEADHIAHSTPVHVLAEAGDQMIVDLRSIDLGAHIIVRGSAGLFDGAPISVRP